MSTPPTATDHPTTAPQPQQPQRPTAEPTAEPTPSWVPGVRAIAAGVVAVLVVFGTVGVVGSFFLRTREEVRTFTGTVSQIRVSQDVGDVRLTADAPDGTARVTANITDSFSEVTWSARLQGSTLFVEGRCDQKGVSFFGCDVDFTVSLPPGAAVQLESDTGDVSVDGGFAAIEASTSTGDVKVSEITGPVKLRTNTGDIRALALGGSVADLKTQTGDVRVEFATPPTIAVAQTNTGDVRVQVPRDATQYQVSTNTDTGDVSVDVANVPTATDHRISAETDTGDIRVSYR
jgi:hypothetical protein